MKNKLKIKVHPFFYIVGILCFITGYFKYFIISSSFIIIHELGHITGGIFYNWKIKKIVFFPFGGITIFEEKVNRPIQEEFLILLLGPLYQICFYLLISFIFGNNPFISLMHYSLLLFNLLPIYPLDGSKLFHLLLDKICSFQKSYQITIIISYIVLLSLLILIIYNFNLVFFICLILLLFKLFKFHQNFPYLFKKFLWERYTYSFSFRKKKKISKIKQMKRDYKHLFITPRGYQTEREILGKMFDLN